MAVAFSGDASQLLRAGTSAIYQTSFLALGLQLYVDEFGVHSFAGAVAIAAPCAARAHHGKIAIDSFEFSCTSEPRRTPAECTDYFRSETLL